MTLNSTAIARVCRRVFLKVARCEFAVWTIGLIGAIGLIGFAPSADAQEVCPDGSEPSATAEECITPRPTPSRLRPTFSEEEERGFQERSFADSFLSDALTGMSDPLGGGSVGGDVEGDMILDELEPDDRGFILEPGFDPTDVIIPLDAVSK